MQQEQKQKSPHKPQQFVNQYMSEKAGMAQIDKEKIAQIIEKLTENTPKASYEKQQKQKRQIQLAELLRKTLEFTSQKKRQVAKSWEPEIEQMKANRPLHKFWAHLDFDMFYIACELLDKPELKDKPCAVGGDNMICTSNYHARKYGVRAALPGFIARKLCPQLIIIKTDFPKYKKFSSIFRDILRTYDAELETHGLDEAYVELTKQLTGKSLQEQHEVVKGIRNRIYQATGLTVSCGVGANKMLAKLASEQKKPNDQFILPNEPGQIVEFMKGKKIRKIPGIGPVNEFFMRGLGIQLAGDILNNLDTLTICFSRHSVDFYVSRALGLGSIDHEFEERKSLGKSQTFKATNSAEYLKQKIEEICEEVSVELEELGYVTENVVFSYQSASFHKKDKSFRLQKYTSKKQDLVEQIIPYMKANIFAKNQKIRLLGARCSSIIKTEELKKMQLCRYINDREIKKDSDEKKSNGEYKVQRMSSYECPICNVQVECYGNLATFNRHVDKCLSGDQKAQLSLQVNDKIETKSVKNQKQQKQQETVQLQKPITKTKSLRSLIKNGAKSQVNTILNFLKK